MKNLPRTLTAVLVAIICFSAMQARADVILQQLSPISTGGSYFFPGLSITIPAGGPWNNIRFNFYDSAKENAAGSGIGVGQPTLIILTQEFLGKSTNLGPLTPGYLAGNESGDNSQFYFDPSVVLQPSTTYWFMTTERFYTALFDPINAIIKGGLNSGGISGGVPGVQSYYAETVDSNYSLGHVEEDWDFRLQGTPIPAVPEPGTVALVGVGLAGLATARRRRNAGSNR